LKLWDSIKKLFHRQKEKASDWITIKLKEPIELEPGGYEISTIPKEPILIRKMGDQAKSQNIGRFMKHGHQAPWYRKSVKAKIQPKEEED
jgi:hypothetical protein